MGRTPLANPIDVFRSSEVVLVLWFSGPPGLRLAFAFDAAGGVAGSSAGGGDYVNWGQRGFCSGNDRNPEGEDIPTRRRPTNRSSLEPRNHRRLRRRRSSGKKTEEEGRRDLAEAFEEDGRRKCPHFKPPVLSGFQSAARSMQHGRRELQQGGNHGQDVFHGFQSIRAFCFRES